MNATSAVVLDANIFRRLARGTRPDIAIAKGRALAAADRALGRVAVASPCVALELMGHLADPVDPAFADCLSALCMMAVQCNQAIDARGHLNLLHMSDDMVAKTLWGLRTAEAQEFGDRINLLALDILANPTETGLAKMREHLAATATFVGNVERSYVNLLKRFVARLRDRPIGNRSFERALATSDIARDEAAQFMVLRAQTALDRDPDSQMAEYIRAIRAKFVVAVEFGVQRIGRIVDGAGPDSDANSVWDWELSFLAGRLLAPSEALGEVGPLPLRLVTNDKALHRAARACNHEAFVLSGDQYRRGLLE
jgi:hypothetical protein